LRDVLIRANSLLLPKSARNARIRKVRIVTLSGLSESLLIADRNACFKRCLTSATPCFLREILLFQWLKCLLCCWIRAYARIWVLYFEVHTTPLPKLIVGRESRGAHPLTPYDQERWRWMFRDLHE